jgi:hypothetical protein
LAIVYLNSKQLPALRRDSEPMKGYGIEWGGWAMVKSSDKLKGTTCERCDVASNRYVDVLGSDKCMPSRVSLNHPGIKQNMYGVSVTIRSRYLTFCAACVTCVLTCPTFERPI